MTPSQRAVALTTAEQLARIERVAQNYLEQVSQEQTAALVALGIAPRRGKRLNVEALYSAAQDAASHVVG